MRKKRKKEKKKKKKSLFFYIIYSLLRYKISHGALAMVKTKPNIQNKQTKEITGTKHLHKGSVPVPGPHTGTKTKQVNQGNPPTTSGNYKQLEKLST